VRSICAIAAAIVGLSAVAAEATAQAPGGVPRIGYLETSRTAAWAEAFTSGLSELGYVENRTIVIERRSAAGYLERLPELAAELVRLHLRVIVVSDPPAALALRNATATIPIVMANGSDPVGLGLIDSLGRPGGNITGLSSLATGLMGKRLELLAEIVLGLSRVGVVWDPSSAQSIQSYQGLQTAASTLRMALESFEVRLQEDFEPAFKAAHARTGGVAVLNGPVVVQHRELVVAAAARHKVPAVYYDSEFSASGGLLSYGPNRSDLHRRAAVYVDKILRGAKPADLPVEQPTKFELVVNLKTAKALGITMPQSILLRADEVIE
jgi:putative ABC transport system substrate-binding protein